VITTDVVQQSIVAGIRAGYRVRAGGPTTEVDLLIGLFTRTLPLLQGELDRSNARTAISGLYLHRRPYVFWPPGLRAERSGRCPLCDLLIVAHDRPSGRWQALALQLRVAGRGQPSAEEAWLLERWPEFQYDLPAGLTRRIPHEPDEHVRHGAIAICDCGGSDLACRHRDAVEEVTTTVPTQRSVHDLAGDLARMLEGRDAGLGIDGPAAPAEHDVSRVVWDLFGMTRGTRWRQRLGSRAGGPRAAVTRVELADGGEGIHAGGPGIAPQLSLWQEVPLSPAAAAAADPQTSLLDAAGDALGPELAPPPPPDAPFPGPADGLPAGGPPVIVIERDGPRRRDRPGRPRHVPGSGRVQRELIRILDQLTDDRGRDWRTVEQIVELVAQHGGSPPDSVRRALSDLAGSDRAFDVTDRGSGPLYRRRDASRL